MSSGQGADFQVDLNLTIVEDRIEKFFYLLQQGFMVKAKVGCTIKEMFTHQFGISPDYLAGRIQTIFLDGKAVDNADTAIVRDGSTLALSAAMPGLVGATFRRGGYLASFRSQITYTSDAQFVQRQDGQITIKLFNLLLKEMGPTFLGRGIIVKREVLEDFLRRQPTSFWAEIKTAVLDGKVVDLREILEKGWPGKQAQQARLLVRTANE